MVEHQEKIHFALRLHDLQLCNRRINDAFYILREVMDEMEYEMSALTPGPTFSEDVKAILGRARFRLVEKSNIDEKNSNKK